MFNIREIDVSDWPELGQELVDRVIKEAKPSNFIITPPPNTIILNRFQYESLEETETLQFMSEYSDLLDIVKASKERLFYTPDFVMEVRVKGEDYATKTPKSDD